jgi:hypothetical protein
MTKFEYAKAHAKNRQTIKRAITQVNRSLNTALKENATDLEAVNVRVLIILYAAYLEASLNFIINNYGAQISDMTKEKVAEQRSEVEKWNCLIDELFKRQFLRGKHKPFNLVNLGHTNFNRYVYIKSLLENEIRVVIEIRNKLAHGQWSVAFTNEGDNKNQEITTKIWTWSKKNVLSTKNVVNNFVKIVDTLAASEESFKKTFDDIVNKLETTKLQHEQLYDWLISEIKRKKPQYGIAPSV